MLKSLWISIMIKVQSELLSVRQKHEYDVVLEQIQKVNVDEALSPKDRFEQCTKSFFEQRIRWMSWMKI